MRYPKDHKQRSHQQILAAAGRVFRRDGYAGGGVAAVMAEAGMTKGGFSAHFDSKEDLFEQALATALEEGFARLTDGLDALPDREWIAAIINRYLSRQHCDMVQEGCPLPGLLAEVGRAGNGPRLAFENYLQRMVERVGARCEVSDDRERREDVWTLLATCVGGMTLARAVADPKLADEILQACRDSLLNRPSNSPESQEAE